MLFCSYDPTWKDEASKRGIWRIDDGVEAMGKISQEKNMALFERQKVMNAQECKAREIVFYGHYTGVVEMEALSLIDMLVQQVSFCNHAQVSMHAS
jgi:glutamine synthetase